MSQIAPNSGLTRSPRDRRDDAGRPPDRRGPGSQEGGGFRGRFRPQRRKVCAFCVDKIDQLDYKDAGRLRGYISERGNDVTAAFVAYASPLIGPPLTPLARLSRYVVAPRTHQGAQ